MTALTESDLATVSVSSNGSIGVELLSNHLPSFHTTVSVSSNGSIGVELRDYTTNAIAQIRFSIL